MPRLISCIFALLVTCCALLPAKHPDAPRARTPQQQMQAAVAISVVCGGRSWVGSGVMIDSNSLLTAYHVVNCRGPSEIKVGSGQSSVLQSQPTVFPSNKATLKLEL